MAKARRIVQLIFLIFFLVLFLRARYPYEVSIPSDIFLRFSPLTPLFYLIDSLYIPLFLWPALVILTLTIFLGRFFCSWICPLGTSLDIFNRLTKRKSKDLLKNPTKLRWIKFGILTTTIILAIFSINLWGYFDPLAIFTRITTVIFYPFMGFIFDKFLLFLVEKSIVISITSPIYDWYKIIIMPEEQILHTTILITALLIVLIFALEKITRRFWCRYICPAGALLGFLSQFRFYERIVKDNCPICNLCLTNCKMNAIPAEIKEVNKIECIECFNCGEKCPPKYKSIIYRWRFKPYRSKPDFQRRQFIQSVIGGFTLFGLFSISSRNKIDKSKIIRPPGSLPEDEFLDKCIRCMECVRICESNGACLQPGGFDKDLLHLWTPVAIMREGYCEYNCILCGQICPTDAILPITLEVKQKLPMGLAYFDKNLCIPYERHEDCIVCEEHCPTPDKAIKFDKREAILPDGSKRLVKYPYVVRELCIGCGICEQKCPLPNLPGVFVTTENEKRLKSLEDSLS